MRWVLTAALMFIIQTSAIANDLYSIPSYDGSLLWKADVENLLKHMLDDLTRMLKPVRGRISSNFGMRVHPIMQIAKHHSGIDIACAEGSEVRAAIAGRVTIASRSGGYGNLVELTHDGPFSRTRYGHLSKILVQQGARVNKGDLLGLSGMTGLATGPHLHFEVWKGEKAIDPAKVLMVGER